MNEQVMTNQQVLSGEKPRRLRMMAAPISFIALAAISYLFADYSIGPPPPDQLGSAFWPKMCLVGIGLSAIFKGVEIYRRNCEAGECDDLKVMDNHKLALMIALIVLVVPAISYVGFPVSSVIFFWLFMRLAGEKKLTTLLPISVLGTVALLYLFVKVVYIPLPRGEWFFDDLTLFIYRILFIH